MRRATIYRLSFRLTSKDLDLLWLDADSLVPSLSVLVKKVLRGLLGEEQEPIPLPEVPCLPLKTKTIGVRFYKGEDEAIVAWLQNIEKGSRGLIVKELLRHAMVTVDYRPYVLQKNIKLENHTPKRKPRQLSRLLEPETWMPPVELPTEGGEQGFSEPLPDLEDEGEDDDWLSTFEKMSQQ